MKIVHIITRLIVGGAQENTLLTCRGLAAKGHDVTLIAGPETGPEGSLWPQTAGGGYTTISMASLRREVRPHLDGRALLELRRLLGRMAPDVVHTHSSKAGILGRWAAAKAGVPRIVHTIHGMSFNRTQGLATRLFYRALERRASRRTSAFIAVAHAMIDQSVAARIAPRDRFTMVRSGIETDLYVPDPVSRQEQRKELGIDGQEIVVGTIARLSDGKGYDELIAAMPAALGQEPRLRFVWVGDGTRRAEYEQRLRALGLRDRVVLVGLVEPCRIPGIVNAFDILVHASRWEGLPRALVQALLLAVPVVSFNNDGAPEVVIPDQTGILVPLDDIAGLATGMVQLARDPQLRSRMGLRGRELCRQEFDWRSMVDAIERVYAAS